MVDQVLHKHPPPQDVSVATEIAADLPSLFVDRRQVEQVLGNLVDNAYQAMTGGGTLTVGATPRGRPRYVTIVIADTGCGIPQENMDKLFEPLFTTKARGIGLGLVTSENLLKLNGGTIDVESEEEVGSTFTVWLPAARRGEEIL